MKNLTLFFSVCFLFVFTFSLNAQTTWEFDGTPYAYQKAHFDSATNIIKAKLGLQMHTFGAPYNQIDATLIQVMSEDTSYKVLLLGQLNPSPASGAINLTKRVQIENGTGIPDYNYFLTSYYSKKGIYTDYMVMQGHPYAWTTPAKRTEFQNIVNFLISTDSVVFNTPYGYYKYLTDMSIPRTTKVQVILKLDDLRATSSLFYPCFPTYDFLVTNQVKASFGVNWMWDLTQSQIDTLHYYLSQTTTSGDTLFEIWNHGLDHSMNEGSSGGDWSSPATWPSNYVPTDSDDVVIPAGVTVTIDITNAVCKSLTISGTLVALNTAATALKVNGNLLINSGGSFTSPYLSTGTSNIIHNLSVYGNFTNSGGTFDFRAGSSGTTMRVMNTSFLGSNNSTINVGTYSSTNNNFNSITVNKSNGAKVICASNVFIDQGASTCRSQLTLTNGIVETGNKAIHVLSLTSADLITPSATSYINGALGRGMSNSGGKNCLFPVGDASGYRPISVQSTTSGVASGHYVLVRCVPTNANTGSTTFTGGIDKVSMVRYYQISYNKGIGSGATSMSFNQFSPSYGTDDGVQDGNADLRVSYSTDERTTWNGMSQTIPHITTLSSSPTTITPDILTSAVTLNTGSGYIYAALARATGTTTNPLSSPKDLTLTALIQGFYNDPGAGYALVPDTVTVELRKGSAPYGVEDQAKVVLNPSGNASPQFYTVIDGTSYYIVIKHRNAMETWSATAQSFTAGTMSYDFTTAQNKALGNNMKQINGEWCFYVGDINQDGFIETEDLNGVYNDNVAGVEGPYVITDLNYDTFVETEDLNLVFDNNVLGVEVKRPLDYPLSNIEIAKKEMVNQRIMRMKKIINEQKADNNK